MARRVQKIIKYLRDCDFFLVFTVPIMAILLCPYVSIYFNVVFSCSLPIPAPILLTPLPLHFSLAFLPSLKGNNIYQDPEEPVPLVAMATNLIRASTVSFPPSVLFFCHPVLHFSFLLIPLPPISISFRGSSSGCKCTRWPLFR